MRYLALLLLFTVVLASCKKDYTCQYTYNLTGVGTSSFNVEASPEADAESACKEASNTTQTCFVSKLTFHLKGISIL